jgi:3,4-dihydroxy 2-butanone 4-phosphate synthase/GTP cyclohydrolase II
MPFSTIEQAIADFAAGKLVIVADDEDRENEGDLICAASLVTPELITFMVKRAGGLICVALTGERADQLGLAPMAESNPDEYRTGYTVSVDASARFGVTTGISAQDRATTVKVLVDPGTVRSDLHHGGHVFPLRARDGGVLQRVGHTETAVDLARLAASIPPASSARCSTRTARRRSARSSRRSRASTASRSSPWRSSSRIACAPSGSCTAVAEARMPTQYGSGRSTATGTTSTRTSTSPSPTATSRTAKGVLVRMHSKCLTGDVFHSMRCDCGWQLETAMQMIQKEGAARSSTSTRKDGASAC